MRYLVLIGHDEKGGKRLRQEQHQALFTAYQTYEAELKKAGALLGGDPLQPSDSAVRISSVSGNASCSTARSASRKRSSAATSCSTSNRETRRWNGRRAVQPRSSTALATSSCARFKNLRAWRSGPAAGLAIVDPLLTDPALATYPFLPSVRADLLAKLGRFEEARAEVERAVALTQNVRGRALFLQRAGNYARRQR